MGAASASLALGSAVVFGCQARDGLSTQQQRGNRVGWLSLSSAADNAADVAAFRAGLEDLGYSIGRTLLLDERYADGREERLPVLTRELASGVDVLVTSGTETALAAIRSTSTLPIVFTNTGDPLGSGLVYSLTHPGANATGLSSVSSELAGKRLEFLKSAAPDITRVAVLWSAGAEQDVVATQTSANWLGLQILTTPAITPDDVQSSLQSALAARADALVAISTPVVNAFNTDIARFASSHGMPNIAEQHAFVSSGGLLAYGASTAELCRRAATFVDKILAGRRPADLPVERADRFELIINLRTAQALKVVLPQGLLLQANEVEL